MANTCIAEKHNDIPHGYIPLVTYCDIHGLDICKMMALHDAGRLKLKVFLLAEDTPAYIMKDKTRPPEFAKLSPEEAARRKKKNRSTVFVQDIVNDERKWVRPYSQRQLAKEIGVTEDKVRRFLKKTGLAGKIKRGAGDATVGTIPPSVFKELVVKGKEYFELGLNKKPKKSEREARKDGIRR